MEIIERNNYLNKLLALKDKQIIKIVTGIRRCGKSTLLEMYQHRLLLNGVESNQIIAVNFESFDFLELRDPKKLYEYINSRISVTKMNYIFLDEIQHVYKFPDVVNSLFIKKNVDLYITGSNAYMLSSEIATLISGRYVEIPMLPLSFKEYVQSTGDMRDLSLKYANYTRYGGFPYSLELRDQPQELNDYLRGIYSTIVLKDVVDRKKVSDVMMLENVMRFAFDNIGNILSTKRIADTMTSNGHKIDVKTVEKYLSALIKSFVLYQAKRYNIKGKQYLKTLEKYYVVDMGLRSMLLGSASFDVGHILENVVYLELLRRGRQMYVGKVDELEVDFVATDADSLCYYQVAATVREPSTLLRELAPLQNINDNNPKYLLSLDDESNISHNGIMQINVLEWLLQ
ncbi:MAG: hypothetical protein BWY47_00632 [Bacteroidetes bacterium ADurb.Bin302]|nr:MAG: hypothetical protein BWY47_00632 [Bacteroidetes bacterium ADurb.Bin302]